MADSSSTPPRLCFAKSPSTCVIARSNRDHFVAPEMNDNSRVALYVGIFSSTIRKRPNGRIMSLLSSCTLLFRVEAPHHPAKVPTALTCDVAKTVPLFCVLRQVGVSLGCVWATGLELAGSCRRCAHRARVCHLRRKETTSKTMKAAHRHLRQPLSRVAKRRVACHFILCCLLCKALRYPVLPGLSVQRGDRDRQKLRQVARALHQNAQHSGVDLARLHVSIA